MPTVVYEPLGAQDLNGIENFERGLSELEAGNTNQALKIMRELPNDPVALRYVKHFESGGGRTFTLTDKQRTREMQQEELKAQCT